MTETALDAIIGICDGFNLLLPADMVADVVSGVKVKATERPQAWQCGDLNWHGITIPVLSFEQIIKNCHARLRGSHIAIIRATANTHVLPFYAVPTQSMPIKKQLESAADLIEEPANSEFKQVAATVRVRGVLCLIPEITEIEQRIATDIQAQRAVTD